MLKKIIKCEKGMTLVELLVSMLIACLLIAVAGSIFLTSGNILSKYSIIRNEKQLVSNIGDFMLEELPYATYLEISTDTVSPIQTNHVIEFASNGKVYYDGEDITLSDDYNDMAIFIEISNENIANEKDTVLDADIIIENIYDESQNENVENYKYEVSINMINMLERNRQISYTDNLEVNQDNEEVYSSKDQNIYIYYKTLK